MSQHDHNHSISRAVIQLTPAQYEELSARPTRAQLDDAVAKTLEALEAFEVEADKARRFAVLLDNSKDEIKRHLEVIKEKNQQVQALERSVEDSIKQVKKLEKTNAKLEESKGYALQQVEKMKRSIKRQEDINKQQNNKILELSRSVEDDSFMDIQVGNELFNVFRIMHQNEKDFSRFLRVAQRHAGVAYHTWIVEITPDGQVGPMENPVLPDAVIDRCMTYFSDNLTRINFDEA